MGDCRWWGYFHSPPSSTHHQCNSRQRGEDRKNWVADGDPTLSSYGLFLPFALKHRAGGEGHLSSWQPPEDVPLGCGPTPSQESRREITPNSSCWALSTQRIAKQGWFPFLDSLLLLVILRLTLPGKKAAVHRQTLAWRYSSKRKQLRRAPALGTEFHCTSSKGLGPELPK